MVKWWDEQLDRSIKITKARIKHHEKHGCGEATMKDKATLKKQERTKEIRKDDKRFTH